MSMVNESIDLMEKETTDLVLLRAWRDELIDSISKAADRSAL